MKEIFVNWTEVSSNPVGMGQKSSPGDDTETLIVDAAEQIIRSSGYHGCSLEDVAAASRLSQKSIQSYFPCKADLGKSVATRFSNSFVDALGNPEEPGATRESLLRHFIELYRHTLTVDGRLCPFGTLTAEFDSLPIQIQKETRRFFKSNIDWLKRALRWTASEKAVSNEMYEAQAFQIMCSLQGACLVSEALGDFDNFIRLSDQILEWYGENQSKSASFSK